MKIIEKSVTYNDPKKSLILHWSDLADTGQDNIVVSEEHIGN